MIAYNAKRNDHYFGSHGEFMTTACRHYHDGDLVQDFLAAMACSVTSVTIVATDGIAGRFGVTVSAFASVSAEPPLLLVCMNRRSPVVAALEKNRQFSVNILQESQTRIAEHFAGRGEGEEVFRFSHTDWVLPLRGSPLLIDASASFDCLLEEAHDAGTHRICIGGVQSVERTEKRPLAFSNRAYQGLAPKEL